jgi:hypothetical protein
MDTLFHQTGLMVAAIEAENRRAGPAEEHMERSAEVPALGDQLMLQAGQIMITMGERLMEIGMKNNQPSQDPT